MNSCSGYWRWSSERSSPSPTKTALQAQPPRGLGEQSGTFFGHDPAHEKERAVIADRRASPVRAVARAGHHRPVGPSAGRCGRRISSAELRNADELIHPPRNVPPAVLCPGAGGSPDFMQLAAPVAPASQAGEGQRRAPAKLQFRVNEKPAIGTGNEKIVQRHGEPETPVHRLREHRRRKRLGPLVRMDHRARGVLAGEQRAQRAQGRDIPHPAQKSLHPAGGTDDLLLFQAKDGQVGSCQQRRVDGADRAENSHGDACGGHLPGGAQGHHGGPAVEMGEVAEEDDLEAVGKRGHHARKIGLRGGLLPAAPSAGPEHVEAAGETHRPQPAEILRQVAPAVAPAGKAPRPG